MAETSLNSFYLIKNAKLHREGQDTTVSLLIGGGRILRLGPDAELGLSGLPVYDAQGLRLLPGYIDQHVHITGGGGEGGFAHQVPPIQLSDIIRGGVTTIAGLLGTDGTSRSVENLLAKCKGLHEEGLTTFCYSGSYNYPSVNLTGSVLRDIVFISEIIGVKVAISDHRASGILDDDLMKLAYEARQGGVLAKKPGVVHIHVGGGKDGISSLFRILERSDLPVTTFRPTHMEYRPEESLRFAQMGGFVDLTSGSNPEKTAARLAELIQKAPASQFTLSSDANGSMPKWNEKKEIIGIRASQISANHACVCHLVKDHGLSLEQAASFLTENPAKALGLWPRKGLIARDADADLLFVDEKSLSIRSVFAMGVPMMLDGELKKKGCFED